MARRLARLVARAFAALVPFGLGRRLFQVWVLGIGGGPPKKGLRRLLKLEDDVYRRIDRLAIDYDGGVHVKHRLMRYHDFFVERVKSGERVLDIGCGKGELAFDIAARAGGVVTAIDNNPDYLAFARARFSHPNLTFVEADALVGLPEGRFDVVVLSNVLEHIELREEFLRRVVAAARPSRVLIRVPVRNRHWLVPLRRELGLPHFSDPTHRTEYDPDSLERELAAAGLRLTHLEFAWGEIWAQAEPV